MGERIILNLRYFLLTPVPILISEDLFCAEEMQTGNHQEETNT